MLNICLLPEYVKYQQASSLHANMLDFNMLEVNCTDINVLLLLTRIVTAFYEANYYYDNMLNI